MKMTTQSLAGDAAAAIHLPLQRGQARTAAHSAGQLVDRHLPGQTVALVDERAQPVNGAGRVLVAACGDARLRDHPAPRRAPAGPAAGKAAACVSTAGARPPDQVGGDLGDVRQGGGQRLAAERVMSQTPRRPVPAWLVPSSPAWHRNPLGVALPAQW